MVLTREGDKTHQSLDVHIPRRHVLDSVPGCVDVLLRPDMVVGSAEADNMRVTCRSGAVANSIGELVERVRDAGPRSHILVRDLGMHFHALIDVAYVHGRRALRIERRIESDRVEDVERDGRNQPETGVLATIASNQGGFIPEIADRANRAIERIRQVPCGEGFLEEPNSEA